jgi:hypothetical protein
MRSLTHRASSQAAATEIAMHAQLSKLAATSSGIAPKCQRRGGKRSNKQMTVSSNNRNIGIALMPPAANELYNSNRPF